MKQLKAWFSKHLTLTRLDLDNYNKMYRIGLGLNKGNWFFRIDWGTVGWRLAAADPIVMHLNDKPIRRSELPKYQHLFRGEAGPIGR